VPRESVIIFGQYEELTNTAEHANARIVAERLFQRHPIWREPATVALELHPRLLEGDQDRQKRCEQLFEDFCTVTESVRRGITINVNVVDSVGDRAA
jgi:hypothetical protein